MQTKTTIQIIALCMIVSATMMLSSCSTSNMVSSQNPHYHLNLVKAGKATTVTAKANNAVPDIAPMTHHSSMASYTSDEQLNNLTSLLSNIKQIENKVKKSNPKLYNSIKNININKAVKQLAIPRNKMYRSKSSSVTNTNDQSYDLMRDPTGLFYIWAILLGASIVLFLLTSVSSIFYLLGGVVAVAFIIFLFLWILAVAKVPDRVS